MTDLTHALAVAKRGVIDLISEEELVEKLNLGRPLRLKLGADPTAPDLTLGHMVQMRAMRKLQDLGHHIVFIVGDFTGMIGDPSGRSTTRPQLTRAEVEANAKTYVAQAGKIIDLDHTEIRFNSEWLGALTPPEILRLMGKFTVAQMLEREDFAARFAAQAPIGLHELLYPLVQGYDSYAIAADIEFGGTDQTFNLMVGRDIQRQYGMAQQVVITRPLIPGTDGEKKMSKSLGNYIAVLDTPDDMYGKIMSLPDKLIPMYLEYLTDVPMPEIDEMVREMAGSGLNPRDAKDRLAVDIVGQLHGADAARAASDAFRRTFSGRGQTLEDFRANAEAAPLPAGAYTAPVPLARLMADLGMTASVGEARRLIAAGAVYLDSDKIENPQAVITPREGLLIRAGKRRIVVLTKA